MFKERLDGSAVFLLQQRELAEPFANPLKLLRIEFNLRIVRLNKFRQFLHDDFGGLCLSGRISENGIDLPQRFDLFPCKDQIVVYRRFPLVQKLAQL